MKEPGIDTASRTDADPRVETLTAFEAARPFLDGAIDQYDTLARHVVSLIKDALEVVRGNKFGKMSIAERGEFIAKVRLLLLRSDHRIVCPECREPSLPYYLTHTKKGTVQLQHKHVKPSSHVIFGVRGGNVIFPSLTLVQVAADNS